MTKVNISKLALSYADLCLQIKALEEAKAEQANQLLTLMPADRMALPNGLLMRVDRTTYRFGAKVKRLEDILKDVKAEEIEAGRAKATVKQYIRFMGVNEKETA